jgi:GNAT superfamily N-acetyltransferase
MNELGARVNAPPRGLSVDGPSAVDRSRLEAMFDRCSASTLFHRFHGGGEHVPTRYLDRALAQSETHVFLVARLGDDIVGVAEAHRDGNGTSEIAVVVEDAWQHRGVGTRLVSALITNQRSRGVAALSASVLPEDSWVLRRLGRLGSISTKPASGIYDAVLELPRRR